MYFIQCPYASMASHVVHTQVLKFFGSFADPRGETVSLVIEFMDAGSLDHVCFLAGGLWL